MEDIQVVLKSDANPVQIRDLRVRHAFDMYMHVTYVRIRKCDMYVHACACDTCMCGLKTWQ